MDANDDSKLSLFLIAPAIAGSCKGSALLVATVCLAKVCKSIFLYVFQRRSCGSLKLSGKLGILGLIQMELDQTIKDRLLSFLVNLTKRQQEN